MGASLVVEGSTNGLSLRRLLTYLERRVTIDSYTNVISLWSALLLMMILFPSV